VIPIAKPAISEDEIENVKKVLKSGFLVQGEWVKKFEEKFAEYIHVNNAVATINGTAALDIALKAIGVTSGDEVIVPDFTFIATANSVLYQNAKPVFADVDIETFCIDIDDVLEKITSKTKAIIAVHLFGHPCEISALKEICNDKKLFLVEDCAQAHGAEENGKKVGSFGIGCFSFYATKNITTGEGGMITTNNSNIADKIRLLINHGQTNKYLHETIGFNLRMTNIQAAIGISQLNKLNEFNKKRIHNAEYYNKNIINSKLIKPMKKNNVVHVYHQYVLRVQDNRDEFVKYLNTNDIGTGIHYPLPIHRQPLYVNQGYDKNICKVATQLSKEVVSIPVHQNVTEENLQYITETLNKW